MEDRISGLEAVWNMQDSGIPLKDQAYRSCTYTNRYKLRHRKHIQ
jgi:hypothetical protein